LDHSHPPLAGTKRWLATGQAVLDVILVIVRVVIGSRTDNNPPAAMAMAGH
jgi:hypothetical protein